MPNYLATDEEFNHYTNKLFKLLKDGTFKLRIHKIYPLPETAQAHRVGVFSFWCQTQANISRISRRARLPENSC